MFSIILDEAVNGWVVTTFNRGDKQTLIYETLNEALEGIDAIARNYNYQVKEN